MNKPIRRTYHQADLIGIPPRMVKTSPRRAFSTADRWGLVALVVLVIAIVIVSAFAPRPVPTNPQPRWRLPGIERPADLDEVAGLYPAIRDVGAVIECIPIFYHRRIELKDGKEVYVFGWHRDGGDGMLGLDLGAPLYWTTRDEAERLDPPKIPDLYLWAKAKERVR